MVLASGLCHWSRGLECLVLNLQWAVLDFSCETYNIYPSRRADSGLWQAYWQRHARVRATRQFADAERREVLAFNRAALHLLNLEFTSAS